MQQTTNLIWFNLKLVISDKLIGFTQDKLLVFCEPFLFFQIQLYRKRSNRLIDIHFEFNYYTILLANVTNKVMM